MGLYRHNERRNRKHQRVSIFRRRRALHRKGDIKMLTYALYIKTPSMDDFQIFTEGNDAHIEHWIKYITRKYPHASYQVQVIQDDGVRQ